MSNLAEVTGLISTGCTGLLIGGILLRKHPLVLCKYIPLRFFAIYVPPFAILMIGILLGLRCGEDVGWLILFAGLWLAILFVYTIVIDDRINVLNVDFDSLKDAISQVHPCIWHNEVDEKPPFPLKQIPFSYRQTWYWIVFDGTSDYLRVAMDNGGALIFRVGTWETLEWRKMVLKFTMIQEQSVVESNKLQGIAMLVMSALCLGMACFGLAY